MKQGDSLSHVLFIISAEVLTRTLNKLFYNYEFKEFGLPKRSEQLNHLAYEDDTIYFASDDKKNLLLIMKTLHMYEEQLEQLINKMKRFFYSHIKET